MATYNPALPTRPCELQGKVYYIDLVDGNYYYFICQPNRYTTQPPPPIRSEEPFDSVVAANTAARKQIVSVATALPDATLNAAPTGSRIIPTMNYFKDLAMAIEQGLFAKGKRPKAPHLYAAIECHNANYPEEEN